MDALIASVIVAVLGCIVVVAFGPRLGYVDVPADDGLKAHVRPAVPLGGLGVFAGLHIGLLVAGSFDWGLFLASALAVLLGLVDDRIGVAPTIRLVAEIGIGAILMATTDTAFSGPVGFVVGVVAVVVAINAVNLFDGLDGLTGSATLLSAIGLAWLGHLRGIDLAVAISLAAAMVGFLPFNWHVARVFLGDNGAYMIGTVLAYSTMLASPDGVGLPWIVALVPLGVFLLDLVVTITRRFLAGHALFAGDRSHLYDQLRDRGLSVRRVAVAAAAAQLGFVFVAVGVERYLDPGKGVGLVVAISLLLLAGVWRGGFLVKSESITQQP